MDSQTVYALWHTRLLGDDAEDVKLIGIYSTEEKARAAIDRLRNKPGFRDYPAGFEIAATKLDRDGWTVGFVTV